MNQTRPATPDTAAACAVDRSCGPDTGCGCGPNAIAPTGIAQTASRKGLKAGLLGVLCVLGCLAVPVAIGGFAALGGALAGEAWVIVAGLVVAAVVDIVLKRRGGGSICWPVAVQSALPASVHLPRAHAVRVAMIWRRSAFSSASFVSTRSRAASRRQPSDAHVAWPVSWALNASMISSSDSPTDCIFRASWIRSTVAGL